MTAGELANLIEQEVEILADYRRRGRVYDNADLRAALLRIAHAAQQLARDTDEGRGGSRG